MREKFKVLLLDDIGKEGTDILKEKADIYYVNKYDEKSILDALHGKDALIKRDKGIISKTILEKNNSKLKVIGRFGTGVDCIDIKTAEKLGIYVVNTPFANIEAVAEHNIILMLNLAKSIMQAYTIFRQNGNWDKCHYIIGNELFGKNVGFIGLGKIGTRTAEICKKGFHMNIYYYDIRRNPEAEKKLDAKSLNVEELCKIADFLLISMSLNERTKKFFTEEKFDLMKPTSYFINTSRGAIVDEKALINALKKNKIAGAGIDVFEKEPPDKENELLKLDNVISTPHYAAHTVNAFYNMAMVVKDVLRVLEGDKPKYPANNPKI